MVRSRIIAALALVALLFVSCQPSQRVVMEQAPQDKRFELANQNAFSGAQRDVRIVVIKDKETNVEYLVVVHYQGIAICPVVKNEK